MQTQQLWFLLLNLAQQMDIQVRLEDLASHGGLCLLKGRRVVFIDKQLSAHGRLRQLGLCLLAQDVDAFHMLPIVRCYLQELQGDSGSNN